MARKPKGAVRRAAEQLGPDEARKLHAMGFHLPTCPGLTHPPACTCGAGHGSDPCAACDAAPGGP